MVYASDFYTTRRPYYSPTVTSYSVTNPRLIPGVGQAHTYHPSIPLIAHKKMTNTTTPVPHNEVRKTVIYNTLDRIYHKPRSQQSYDPMEDFLNERSTTSFEDVSRSIRANTAALLKKCHTPIPRSIRPLSVSNQYNHIETPISERISSDEYIWHLLRPLPGKQHNGIDVGYYPETSTRVPLGKTHLACLSYAGDHPISRRRHFLVAGPGDDYRNVKNDVELLSYYNKMRTAANLPHQNGGASEGTSNGDAGLRYSHTAPTRTPYTTEKVLTNGSASHNDDEDDKENITIPIKKKSLKKKSSKDLSVDEDRQAKIDDERALLEKQAEEERRQAEEERLAEARRKAEEERYAEEERIAEARRRAEEERYAEEERKRAEAARIEEEERLAEEARIAEEERLAEEERQRKFEEEQKLLEEKLVEEYHREQERLAAEQRELEQQYAEEQQRLAQEKLAEEQRILHEKLLQIQQQQQQEKEEVDEEDVSKIEAEENDWEPQEYVRCNNIPKAEKADSVQESGESDDEPAIAENLKSENSKAEDAVDGGFERKASIKSAAGDDQSEEGEEEKTENTDANNSEISETEEDPDEKSAPVSKTEEQTKTKDESEEESEEEEEEEEE